MVDTNAGRLVLTNAGISLRLRAGNFLQNRIPPFVDLVLRAPGTEGVSK